MTRNRTGLILLDKWTCINCQVENDPESARCWYCECDQDGDPPARDEEAA